MTANRGRAARRRARLLATGLTLTGGLVAAVPGGAAAAAAAAATCVSMTASQSPGPADTRLTGVAVRSPCDALAVGTISGGDSGPGRTLVQHWDGAHWTQVPSQDPGSTDNRLFSVAATSATSAWAVGDFADSTGQYQTLIERLDGSKWTRIDSPAPGQKSDLFAVAATSATNAWAVGSYVPAGADPDATQTLIEHWDGTSWSLSPQSAGSLPGLLAGSAAPAGPSDISRPRRATIR